MSALPAEHAVCFAIVARALAKAREEFRLEKHLRKVSPGRHPVPSFSVDLRSKQISSIPLEAIELIKDEVERLALAHNQLTSLQEGFSGLHRMRYLNLRANLLGEFPAVITRLPSLEILDVSHNQIGSLPEDFGTLMSLKVLSMGKNEITVLPNYIGAMPNLTILKLHHNPIVFPPKDLLSPKDDATDDEAWLEDIKSFLRQHAEKVGAGSESSSDYGPDLGNDSCSSINTATFASRTPSPGSVNSCCCSAEGSDTNNSNPTSTTITTTTSTSTATTTIITTTNQAEEKQKEAPFRLSAELDTIMPHASNSLRTRSVSPSKRSMLSLHQNRSPSPLSNATMLSSSAPMPASSLSPSPSSSIASEQEQPQTPLSESNLSQLERSRSHSESTAQLQTIRGNRRMGMLPPPKSPNAIFQGGGSNNSTTGSSSNSSGSIGEGGNNNLRTVIEQPQPQQHPLHLHLQQQQQQQKASKHQRGYSHDSIIDSAGRTLKKNMGKPADGANGGSQGSPTEKERQPGPYFRRLSSLPENKRTSLSSARVGEAARGILYAMSTLQKPIEHFVQSAVDPNGPHHKVERVLYNGNIHIGSLVGALEAYEEKDDEAAVDQVIDACYSCVAAFRQVLSMLQSSSKEIGAGAAGHDVRYMRTLLLTVYGSYIEIQSSYEILRPLLRTHRPTPSVQSFSSASSMMRGRQPLQINNNPGLRLASIPSASFMSSAAYTTPRGGPLGADYFSLPPTPGLNSVPSSAVSQMSENGFGFDHDEPLYGIFQTAIGAALSTLPVIEKEIKATLGQSLMPNVSLKLRQVSALCVNGADAARKLSKVRWEAIQEGDVGERRRFWDDTNIFTKLIINIAELIKSTHQEYTFRKNMLTAVGMVVRPTKDLYILLNGSSFRMYMAESSSTPNSPPSVLSPTQFGFQSMVASSTTSTPTPTPTMTAPQTWLAATPLSAALGPAAQATLPQGMFYPSPGLGGGGGGGSGSGSNSRSATLMSMVHPTMTSVMSGLGGAGIAMAMPVTPSTPGPEGPMGLGMGLMTPGAARGGVGASSVSLRMG